MSKNNPLLQTLIESPNPEPITMWPQTLGWKVLGLIVLCSLGYASVKAYQNWMSNKYRREAVKQVAKLASSIEGNNTRAQKLNEILKNVAAQSYGNEQVASLHGTSWGQCLMASSDAEVDSKLVMAWQSNLYQRNPGLSEQDLEQLIDWAKRWIRTHHAVLENGEANKREVQHD